MEEYADSKETGGVKIYFYISKGVSIVNEFKNLFMLIFGLYFALKLSSWWWLVIMFLISLPILLLIGWVVVHKMAKIMEWLSIKHGTHYAIRQFTMQEEVLRNLEEINKKLK